MHLGKQIVTNSLYNTRLMFYACNKGSGSYKDPNIESDARLRSRTLVCNLYTKNVKKKISFPLVNNI